MTQVCESPFGFEDGQVVRYAAADGRLEVIFEFWNEQRGTLIFQGLVAVCDFGALGVTVGAVDEVSTSDLLRSLVRRHFEIAPKQLDWRHYRFLDLDDGAMFEVVAQSCSFIAGGEQR